MPLHRHIVISTLAMALLGAMTAALAQTKSPTEKKIYCWNDAGRKVCGDALPASATDSARTEFSIKSGMATAHVAVSYTHLDVYKRQSFQPCAGGVIKPSWQASAISSLSHARSCGRQPEFFWFPVQFLMSFLARTMFQSPHNTYWRPLALSLIHI